MEAVYPIVHDPASLILHYEPVLSYIILEIITGVQNRIFSHETESKSQVTEGFAGYFELKDLKQKPKVPQIIIGNVLARAFPERI